MMVILTKNEVELIADALNGCGMLIDGDPHYIPLMRGSDGALADAAVIGRDDEGRVLLSGSRVWSGLEHELYDAMRLNRLDVKWGVEGDVLLRKLRTLDASARERIVRTVARAWAHCDDDDVFGRTLAELVDRPL